MRYFLTIFTIFWKHCTKENSLMGGGNKFFSIFGMQYKFTFHEKEQKYENNMFTFPSS